jgi:hypothetical protein
MTLEAVFKDLSAKWERLVEELEHGLLWSVTQTQPEEEHTLAHHYVDGATDLLDLARKGLTACRSVADRTLGLAQAGKALLKCQEQYNALAELYDSRLASRLQLRRLRNFGMERGGAWNDWAKHVRDALVRCRTQMDELNRGWFGCWQELTDRIGMQGVSVQAIGQQITMPKTEAEVESAT